jgi:hypothetical protein
MIIRAAGGSEDVLSLGASGGLALPATGVRNRHRDSRIALRSARQIASLIAQRPTRLLGPAFSVAFCPDPKQRHLYVADASTGRIHIVDRRALVPVGGFGRIGVRGAVRVAAQRRGGLNDLGLIG